MSTIVYKEAVKYIASNMSEVEVENSDLRRVLPRRQNRKGTRPTCRGQEALGPEADGDKMWDCPEVKLKRLEKRKILARVMEIAVLTMFSTHCYTFGGRTFHQLAGGPIGLRGTGAIARVVMAMTDRRVMAKLTSNSMVTKVKGSYADDGRALMMPLRKGWRWSTAQDKLISKKEWLQDDVTNGKSGARRTAEAFKEIVNSVNRTLRCTIELGEEFAKGRLPTLDTSIWVEDGKVLNTFYEKPTARKTVIHQQSALSENCKG